MDKVKKIIFFIAVLAVFVIPGFLFGRNTEFYEQLNKPVFAPPGILFAIIWPILYIIQAFFITRIYYNYKENVETKKLLTLLVINGILNIMYMPIFFTFKSLFGGFVVTLLVGVSVVLIIMKSKEIKVKEWYLEIPYLLWSIFALVLSISIYLMN